MDPFALPTSVRLPLRVWSKFHYSVSKRRDIPHLTVTSNDTCRTLQEENDIPVGAREVSLELLASAVLNSACMHAMIINISLNDRHVKLIFTDDPDA